MDNFLTDFETSQDPKVIAEHSRDASIFELKPEIVVFPKNTDDICKIVKKVSERKKTDKSVSLTVRSGGTDMSGGALTKSISLNMRYFNRIKNVYNNQAEVEPGTFYRDFEKETIEKNLILPPYTSSKLICTVGGMVANNAGGEKSLELGKTEKFVDELEMVLSDGNSYVFKKLGKKELEEKMKDPSFEGNIYKKMFEILDSNYDLIKKSKPKVSKNSSGYNIWDIWDKENFNLSQIFVGAQGTLGINTNIKFRLMPIKKEHGLLIIYMKNFDNIPEIVKTVLSFHPSSFESYDDYTLNLAMKYLLDFAPILHEDKLHTTLEFIPEILMKLENKTPKLSLLVEFEEDTKEEVIKKTNELNEKLKSYSNIFTKIAKSQDEEDKEWAIRRESFNLLRNKLTKLKACPFIDDTCVDPEVLPEFLPKLYEILDSENLLYSIAGHIGNGNFHIFPLLDLTRKEEREKIFSVSKRVFDLVLQYNGSTSGEHNDGIVRTPYVEQMFGKEIYKIFEEIKEIFDPLNIFNPGKKVGGDLEFSKQIVIKP